MYSVTDAGAGTQGFCACVLGADGRSVLGEGIGASKREAREAAAAQALTRLPGHGAA